MSKENEIKDYEPIQIDETKPNKYSKYDNPEVIQFVIEKKNDGLSWVGISNLLKERGYENIKPDKVKEIYNVTLAKAITVGNVARKNFDEFTDLLLENYGDAIHLLSDYVKKLRALVKQLDDRVEEGDDDALLQSRLNVIKTIPIMTALVREIRSFMEFQAEQIKEIKITQAEKVVYSTSEISNQAEEFAKTYLKEAINKLKGKFEKEVIKEIEKEIKL
jgi:hypothetical protein